MKPAKEMRALAQEVVKKNQAQEIERLKEEIAQTIEREASQGRTYCHISHRNKVLLEMVNQLRLPLLNLGYRVLGPDQFKGASRITICWD